VWKKTTMQTGEKTVTVPIFMLLIWTSDNSTLESHEESRLSCGRIRPCKQPKKNGDYPHFPKKNGDCPHFPVTVPIFLLAKMVRYSRVLMVLLLTLYCGCIGEELRKTPLGQIDVSVAGEVNEMEFVYPGHISGFTLLPRDGIESDVFYLMPVLELTITDEATRKEIAVQRFSKQDIGVCSWDNPGHSLLLDTPEGSLFDIQERYLYSTLRQQLKKNQTCILRIEVLEPALELGTCEVILHWMQAYRFWG